jgi:hypothetical protein
MIWSRLMHVHVTSTAGRAFIRVMEHVEKLGVERLWAHRHDMHLSYRQLAQWCHGRKLPVPPAVAFIRNPWDWYVRMWSWMRVAYYRQYAGSFGAYMRIVYRKTSGDYVFDPLTQFWNNAEAYGCEYVGHYEDFRGEMIRILTTIMPDVVTAEQVGGFVDEVGVVTPQWEPTVRGTPVSQWKPLRPYQEHHTEVTKRWVAEMDAGLIERFGYKFA